MVDETVRHGTEAEAGTNTIQLHVNKRTGKLALPRATTRWCACPRMSR